MVECYLCKGKLRVTRDKHVFDEKLKKRYHFKCFAGICRVCDLPVYAKSKHKTIGSNVWHEKCYKTAHRHNPATEEGVNRKLRQLSEELGKLRIGGRSKKGATTEQGVTKKLHQLADELGKIQLGKKNPRRPTKEFWAKHYPEVLAQYKKKYPKKEAEKRARKATAAIWYETMGPKKKEEYERIRRKREGRENPIRHLMFSGDKAPAAVFPELEGKKYHVPEGWWIIPDSLHNRKVLQEHGIAFTRYQRPSAAEIVKAYDEQEGRENPPKDLERFEKELLETLDTSFLIYETKKLPATKSVTLMSMRPTPVDRGTYSVIDTPEHRRLLDELGVKYTELRISPEHAKLLIKEMLKRDRRNPTLVTPEMETDIVGAFKRVIHGMGTEADRALVRMAREADVVMSTGPSILLKRNPEECGPVENPEKLDYIIQDEFGTTFETGKGTEQQAEARALHYNKKYMRSFKVIYPKSESPEVKKAAQTAAKEMLKS